MVHQPASDPHERGCCVINDGTIEAVLMENEQLLRILEKIVEAEHERHGYVPAWLDEARAAITKARGE